MLYSQTSKMKKFVRYTILTALFSLTPFFPVFAQSYTAAPNPLESSIELKDMQYIYSQDTQILTKTYKFQNVSGETIESPMLVNLFLWSNDICTTVWLPMSYDGIDTYASVDQSVTVSNNDSTIVWSTEVTPSSISSSALFPSLPVQTSQSGTGYPAWNIPGHLTQWLDGDNATIALQFSNVQNCSWIQNMVWLVWHEPTLIELSMFRAVPGDRSVTLMWSTKSEVDNAGFNVYRTEKGDSEKVKITPSLIPAKGSPTSGSDYLFTDNGVKNGIKYSYTLEDVDIYGVSTEHGPAKATPKWIHSIFHN